MTDAGLIPLAKLCFLSSLDLTAPRVTDIGVSTLSHLDSFMLRDNPNVSHDSIAEIVRNSPNLTHIDLCSCVCPDGNELFWYLYENVEGVLKSHPGLMSYAGIWISTADWPSSE